MSINTDDDIWYSKKNRTFEQLADQSRNEKLQYYVNSRIGRNVEIIVIVTYFSLTLHIDSTMPDVINGHRMLQSSVINYDD